MNFSARLTVGRGASLIFGSEALIRHILAFWGRCVVIIMRLMLILLTSGMTCLASAGAAVLEVVMALRDLNVVAVCTALAVSVAS